MRSGRYVLLAPFRLRCRKLPRVPSVFFLSCIFFEPVTVRYRAGDWRTPTAKHVGTYCAMLGIPAIETCLRIGLGTEIPPSAVQINLHRHLWFFGFGEGAEEHIVARLERTMLHS
jgi:hypothetical protein